MSKDGVSDEHKVMDVSKPGKGRIMTTSRPVFSPVASSSEAEMLSDIDSPRHAPSTANKVIKPINDTEVDNEKTDATSAESSSEQDEQAQSGEQEKEELKEAGETKDSTAIDSDDSKSINETSEVSDSAGVDALVSKAESKKENAKKAEEQARQEVQLQEMIESRKYAVPINRSHSSNTLLIVFSLIIAVISILSAMYLLIDAGIIGDGVELPLDLIK